MRVGGTSLRLFPTMSSLTKPFTKVFSLWTMNVWPTNSGVIVQARAQVLIGSRFDSVFWRWTFLNTLGSTNGPLRSDRLIGLLPPPHDELRGELAPLP